MCCSQQSWKGEAIKTFAIRGGAILIDLEFALLGLSLASVQYFFSVPLWLSFGMVISIHCHCMLGSIGENS